MKFWKDMTEAERRNASPTQWYNEGFWEDDCVFKPIEPEADCNLEWEYIPYPTEEQIAEAGGNELC